MGTYFCRFMDSLKSIGEGIKEAAIWFVIHIPYLVIWAIVIVIIVLILKRSRSARSGSGRRKRKNSPKRKQECRRLCRTRQRIQQRMR